MCPEVTMWCTSVTASSEIIGRPDRGLSQVKSVSSNTLLSHANLAEYMGRVFGDDFGDKHARLPQHSSHFDNAVLLFHHELSQTESFRRHVRAHEWRISRTISNFICFLLWISGERRSVMVSQSYANFLVPQRSCFIGWLVGWFNVGLELRRWLLSTVWN